MRRSTNGRRFSSTRASRVAATGNEVPRREVRSLVCRVNLTKALTAAWSIFEPSLSSHDTLGLAGSLPAEKGAEHRTWRGHNRRVRFRTDASLACRVCQQTETEDKD